MSCVKTKSRQPRPALVATLIGAEACLAIGARKHAMPRSVGTTTVPARPLSPEGKSGRRRPGGHWSS